MITPEEIEHIDWLIQVNRRRKVAAREAYNNTLAGVYARAEQEAEDLKETLLMPPGKIREIQERIFGVDKIRKPDTL